MTINVTDLQVKIVMLGLIYSAENNTRRVLRC